MKKWIFAFSAAISGLSQAAGTIDFLEVDNDVVLFSTTDTKTSSPACVTSEYSDLWSVSLASDSGRAIYSLILTSMAKGDGVALNIESGQNCADRDGVERAAKVNLVTQAFSEQGSNPRVGVYAGDHDRLGTLLTIEGTRYWVYMSGSGPTSRTLTHDQYFNGHSNKPVYFTGANCSGDPWAEYWGTNRNESFNSGRFYRVNGPTQSIEINSYLDGYGMCIEGSETKVLRNTWTEVEHSLCGPRLCYLKED